MILILIIALGVKSISIKKKTTSDKNNNKNDIKDTFKIISFYNVFNSKFF